jgi:hypothetical protein
MKNMEFRPPSGQLFGEELWGMLEELNEVLAV